MIELYKNIIDKIKEHKLDYRFLVVLGYNYYSHILSSNCDNTLLY